MDRGVLVRWNDEKGFGFIQPEKNSDQNVFIHISVLKKMARKPKVGDSILYQMEVQNDGKRKAILASIEGVAILAASPISHQDSYQESPPHSRKRFNNRDKTHQHSRTSTVNTIVTMLIIIAIGVFGFKKYQAFNEAPIVNEAPVLTNDEIEQHPVYQEKRQATPQFQCEKGKTHCNHMRSCAEATFYINHCTNTQMDGDNDGIPCERQWCS